MHIHTPYIHTNTHTLQHILHLLLLSIQGLLTNTCTGTDTGHRHIHTHYTYTRTHTHTHTPYIHTHLSASSLSCCCAYNVCCVARSSSICVWALRNISLYYIYKRECEYLFTHTSPNMCRYLCIDTSICGEMLCDVHEMICINVSIYIKYLHNRWKEPYKWDDILQKRPIISRRLLIVATPYVFMNVSIYTKYLHIHFHISASEPRPTSCFYVSVFVIVSIYIKYLHMGWLRWVGALKSYVSFAEYRLFYRALLQKRPIILRSLLLEAIT